MTLPDVRPEPRRVRIANSRGLHARASRKFVDCAGQFQARVWVERDRIKVEADSIMELLMLAAGQGDEITISAEGAEAEVALEALAALISDGFGETG